MIEILKRDNYYIVAVQHRLESFSGDVKTTKRLIDAQTGPTVVVGPSYGGAVITDGGDFRGRLFSLLTFFCGLTLELPAPPWFLPNYRRPRSIRGCVTSCQG